jgi:hypothetical protein
MKLSVKWEDFASQIDNFATEAKIISDTENSVQNELQLDTLKIDIKAWTTKCYEYLKSSFDSENNEFASSFYSARRDRYSLGYQKSDFNQIKKEICEDFNEKVSTLLYYKRILSISDAIIKSDIVELTNRNNYTTEQTLELILEKLYDLFDNHYHSVTMILEGNGIALRRHGEDRELLKVLEENGYVSSLHSREVAGQLTISGKMYVEEKRKTYKENYNDINKSQEEIDRQIDEIIEKLTNLGYGQEIIFDEIQELKDLYSTLNKKNWGQIVKGKLVDLALAKLIEADTLSFIYEKLTNHTLRLL